MFYFLDRCFLFSLLRVQSFQLRLKSIMSLLLELFLLTLIVNYIVCSYFNNFVDRVCQYYWIKISIYCIFSFFLLFKLAAIIFLKFLFFFFNHFNTFINFIARCLEAATFSREHGCGFIYEVHAWIILNHIIRLPTLLFQVHSRIIFFLKKRLRRSFVHLRIVSRIPLSLWQTWI